MIRYIYLAYLAVLSVVALVAYGADKNKAEKGKWRIPEKVLLLLSFLGGAVGGYAAMNLFRHKTKKWYFQLVNLLGLAWQIAVAVLLFI